MKGLRATRKLRRLSQLQLAQLSGVEQPTISELEAAVDPNPRWHTARKLATTLKVKPHDLFSLKPLMAREARA